MMICAKKVLTKKMLLKCSCLNSVFAVIALGVLKYTGVRVPIRTTHKSNWFSETEW